jgi:hypothetical protein
LSIKRVLPMRTAIGSTTFPARVSMGWKVLASTAAT